MVLSLGPCTGTSATACTRVTVEVTSSAGNASSSADLDFSVQPLALQSLQSSLVAALQSSSMTGTFVTRAVSESVSVSAIMGDGTVVTVVPLNATTTSTPTPTSSTAASASPSAAVAGAASKPRSHKTTAWMATAVAVICVAVVAAAGVGVVLYRRRVGAVLAARKAGWGTAASGGGPTPVVRRSSTRIRTDTSAPASAMVVDNPMQQPLPRGVATPPPPPPPPGGSNAAIVVDHMSRAAAASLAVRGRGGDLGAGTSGGGGDGRDGGGHTAATAEPDAVVVSVSPAHA
jgi:hypothetical protein